MGKKVDVDNLIGTFKFMAENDLLILHEGITQQELLAQIIGIIMAEATRS